MFSATWHSRSGRTRPGGSRGWFQRVMAPVRLAPGCSVSKGCGWVTASPTPKPVSSTVCTSPSVSWISRSAPRAVASSTRASAVSTPQTTSRSVGPSSTAGGRPGSSAGLSSMTCPRRVWKRTPGPSPTRRSSPKSSKNPTHSSRLGTPYTTRSTRMTVIPDGLPQSLAGLLAGSLGGLSRHRLKPYCSGARPVHRVPPLPPAPPATRIASPGFVIKRLVALERHQSFDHERRSVACEAAGAGVTHGAGGCWLGRGAGWGCRGLGPAGVAGCWVDSGSAGAAGGWDRGGAGSRGLGLAALGGGPGGVLDGGLAAEPVGDEV